MTYVATTCQDRLFVESIFTDSMVWHASVMWFLETIARGGLFVTCTQTSSVPNVVHAPPHRPCRTKTFKTAVPSRGQTTEILSSLPPKRGCGTKRVGEYCRGFSKDNSKNTGKRVPLGVNTRHRVEPVKTHLTRHHDEWHRTGTMTQWPACRLAGYFYKSTYLGSIWWAQVCVGSGLGWARVPQL